MSAPVYPRWEGDTLREVDAGLWVGGMGAVLQRPAGTWGGWIGLAQEQVRAEAPAIAKRIEGIVDDIALALQTELRDGAPLHPALLLSALELLRAVQGPVLVSCAVGVSRSASVAYALLRVDRKLSHEEALARVFCDGWPNTQTAMFGSARAWAEGPR